MIDQAILFPHFGMPPVRTHNSAPKPDHFLVSFDRQFVDLTLISLIGSTTNW
jgi:hypothetical protein